MNSIPDNKALSLLQEPGLEAVNPHRMQDGDCCSQAVSGVLWHRKRLEFPHKTGRVPRRKPCQHAARHLQNVCTPGLGGHLQRP